jgi:hypothetical protein
MKKKQPDEQAAAKANPLSTNQSPLALADADPGDLATSAIVLHRDPES